MRLRLTRALFVAIGLGCVLAAPNVSTRSFKTHSVHEKRDSLPNGWTKRSAASRDLILPMRFNLVQSNLDRAEELLLSVSNPASPSFGKHYSLKDIADIFAPSDESISSIMDWFAHAGISSDRVKYSKSKGAYLANLTVAEAEDLLHAKYDIYEHSESGSVHIACPHYAVPSILTEHIDFVTPTIHFDTNPINTLPKPKNAISKRGDAIEGRSTTCDVSTTPSCIRELYHIGNYIGSATAKNSFGILEISPAGWTPSDFGSFMSTVAPASSSYSLTAVGIDGGENLGDPPPPVYITEESLQTMVDTQYVSALAAPIPGTIYILGDQTSSPGPSFNNFLDAIDSSYCGGNDASVNATYPDKNGGYEGAEECGTVKPTHVIASSSGYNEGALSPAYERRQCNEYLKLGLAGVSFLFDSGLGGVAGFGKFGMYSSDVNLGDATCSGANGQMFNPTFPSTCPFVTSVGYTQISPGNTTSQPEIALNQNIGGGTIFYSGGGFSNVFAIPDYQKSAVATYFAKHKPSYTPSQYNNSKEVRGYPDISVNSGNHFLLEGGYTYNYVGTSAPTLAAIIALINDARISRRKGPVGFINPTLYAHPNALNDVTSGSNPGCGTNGFNAVTGWDPVTGLGTPNFPKLLQIFLDLP